MPGPRTPQRQFRCRFVLVRERPGVRRHVNDTPGCDAPRMTPRGATYLELTHLELWRHVPTAIACGGVVSAVGLVLGGLVLVGLVLSALDRLGDPLDAP